MGITSDNVAKAFGITREQQDKLGVQSHARAAAAIKSGRFKEYGITHTHTHTHTPPCRRLFSISLSPCELTSPSICFAIDSEIVPVTTELQDRKTGAIRRVVVDTDDGVRVGTNMQTLGKLKPVFTKNGTTTAGTSSQVSDGAAASILMTRATARQLGLKPLGVLRR